MRFYTLKLKKNIENFFEIKSFFIRFDLSNINNLIKIKRKNYY
jgi:hypothetical protein